jgi:hypothetical protein
LLCGNKNEYIQKTHFSDDFCLENMWLCREEAAMGFQTQSTFTRKHRHSKGAMKPRMQGELEGNPGNVIFL